MPRILTRAPALAQPVRGNPLWVVLACLLLALLQMTWAGYQLGIGNQGIQIPFLEAMHNPQLFSRDQMVSQTLHAYPSFFFLLCGSLLSVMPLPSLYLLLHFLTTAGVFGAVAFLSRSLFRDRWTAPAAFGLLLAGQHSALAGATLYSPGFTHTWAVFPLCLLALGLFYRRHYLWAFALAGITANLHALEAGHVALLMGIAGLCQVRSVGFRRLSAACGLFVLCALPTLVLMARQHQAFDAEWLTLMRIRSADHSFPSSWWSAGNTDLPRFLCMVGLAALAMSFEMRPAQRRKTLLVAGAAGVLFCVGTVFTEVWPVPVVIRAQFFRASGLVLMLSMIVIAHGVVAAVRLGFAGRRRRGSGGTMARGVADAGLLVGRRMAGWRVGVEILSAVLTVAAVALPAFVSLLPLALAVALVVALVNGRLAWHQALVAGVALVVVLLAWETLQFSVPGLPPDARWRSVAAAVRSLSIHWPGVLLLAAVVLFWVLSLVKLSRGLRYTFAVGNLVLAGIAAALLWPGLWARRVPASPWMDVQRWAADHLPVDALFLTPSTPQAGVSFRLLSERAIVGEMRDGTQLYFSAAYSKPWWDRMVALNPGILKDPDGRSLMAPGKPLERLDDPAVLAIANQYSAQYVVLPHSEGRTLDLVYDNGTWAIYRPETAVVSADVHSAELAEEDQFLRTTALPNIDKYRKSDGQLQIVDAAGRALEGAQVRVVQTGSSFGFGASLPFFKQPAVDIGADYKPPAVTAPELERFLEAFNSSVIGFSSQWRFTEPARGKTNYADLDAYVAWCAAHQVRPEFHFVAGVAPAWTKSGDGTTYLRLHAADLAKRYGDRIGDWEVVGDHAGFEQAGMLFSTMRQNAPKARLGMAGEVRMWSAAPAKSQSQLPDIPALEDLRRLKKAGVKVDFVALETRQPTGLWASGSDVYGVLDAFAAEGAPVRVTDFGVPVGARIEGDVREGTWTAALQAEYYERFFTLCFSHPDVEGVNVMGLTAGTWLPGEGLLDERGEPTPAFVALKRLITQKWRTETGAALGADGTFAFRGFQGSYVLTVTTAGGQSATGTFVLQASRMNRLKFQLSADHNLIEMH